VSRAFLLSPEEDQPGQVTYEPQLMQVVRLDPLAERLPEIYAFVNGGSPGWYNVTALTEDGEFLTGHVCSHPSFGPHDMGVVGGWKHEIYQDRYPGGYVVIWIEDPRADERVMAAHRRHVECGEAGTPWQIAKAAERAKETA
jgi:hypothetical protein